MKRNFVIVFLLGIVTLSFSQELFEGHFAPLNPDFVAYQSGNSNPGFIPPAHTVSFDNLPQKRVALSLPEQFDMRTTGLLSPVGNQGIAATCWTFSVMDAIQAVWANMGFDVPTMSKENLANCHGFIALKSDGGNGSMAIAYLSRFNGPVLESSDPYVNNPVGTCNTSITNADKVAVISEALKIPKDVDIIKQMVYRYGAVFTAMSGAQLDSTLYFNSDSSSVYMQYPAAGEVFNHATTIVGWDDNKVIYNPVGHNPSAPGAYIAKGTYGSAKYDNGYFYVSYEDYFVGDYAYVYTGRIEKERVDTVFCYDKLGLVTNFGNNIHDSAWVLVKHTAPTPKLITAIGTYTSVASAIIDIEVYQNKAGEVLSGLLGERKNILCEYPGYHSFDLPVTVSGDFYVKIKYKTPGSKFPIPIEMSEANYSVIDLKPEGLQWIKLRSNYSWSSTATADHYKDFNICVNVYAKDAPDLPHFTTDKSRYCVADTVVFKNTSIGSFDSYDWDFGVDAVPQTAFTTNAIDSFKVVYSSGGMKQVKMLTMSGVTSDSIVKGNAVEIVSGVPLTIINSTSNDTILKNNMLTIDVHGADTYQWSANSYISDTLTERLYFLMGNVTDTFRVTASIGGCDVTDSLIITVKDKCALYDDIEDAKLLTVGVQEGPFNNDCATWETNEPYPVNTDSCDSQVGWCPYEDRLYHSLWFKFVAPSADSVQIVTAGFDNKMALYDALATGTYADIVSGNPSNYSLIAANDDSSDFIVTATIQPVKLTSGKIYWLQMDGSYGGIVGDASITVIGLTTPVKNTPADAPFIVNPAEHGVLIINNAQRILQVAILDLTGQKIMQQITSGEKLLQLNVATLNKGNYLVQMRTKDGVVTEKVLVK